MQESYRRKYFALKRKCDSLELSNERVLNRLCHVKKYIHKLSRERRGLAKKLTELGDEFKKSDLTIPLEDDLPNSMIGVSDSPSSSLPPAGDGQGGLSPSVYNASSTIKVEDAVATETPPAAPGKANKKKRSREVGKSEKERDPNAPKKPANAFLMYCQQERQKVQDREGNGIYSADISHQELTRQLAKQWKFLSEEEKKHYYLMYEKEKDRYDKAVKKYAKGGGGGGGGGDKKHPKVEEDAESETIDVVKTGQEKEGAVKRDLSEEKITLKPAGSEDQTIDVEKDEFEFTDFSMEAEEPKICLEKIDKSKLFDKTRLYGLPSAYSERKSDHDSKDPAKDLLSKTDAKVLHKSAGLESKTLSVLEVKTGKVRMPAMSPQAMPKALPGVLIKPPAENRMKEMAGVRTELVRSQPMVELQSKPPAEDRTVLVSTLKSKPVFDMKTRSSPDIKPRASSTDLKDAGDTDRKSPIVTADSKPKPAIEIRSRTISDLKARSSPDIKSRSSPEPKPRVFSEVKVRSPAEVKSKPFTTEGKSISINEVRVKPSPEIRRMSTENKKPVVELKKFALDPSDDPYHFDD
ncbi:uncharacterized protein [Diadema antillarum]|uniref:uncharacterized protein n=1 Tax=Diadema antillarum TaxID=105358 RepID=UPI003A89BD99